MVKKLACTVVVIIISSSLALAKNYPVAKISTTKGTILVWLYNKTPQHKKSFLQLAKAKYWDTLSFNRVVKNFVIQGGCPDTEQGFTDPNYLLAPEIDSTIKHQYLSFAAGRDNNPNKISARCQFYIVVNKNGLPKLDNKYTVYGKVINGEEVVQAIANTATNKNEEPITAIPFTISIINISKKALQKIGFTTFNL